MKRSRRVVLTMMGSGAVGAVSMGLVPRIDCGPGNVVVPVPTANPIAGRPTMAASAAHDSTATHTAMVTAATLMAAAEFLSLTRFLPQIPTSLENAMVPMQRIVLP
jgi:hypothetical protein